MNKSTHTNDVVTLLSLPLEKLDKREAYTRLEQAIKTDRRCTKVYTPNPQMLLKAHGTPALRDLLSRADLLLPDGIGLCIGARLLGSPLPCRIAGIDAGREVLVMAEKRGLSVALLGAAPGVADRAAKRLRHELPHLRICYTHHGYFDRMGAKNEAVLAELRAAAPDILFVCFGFPAQESWIDQNAHKLPSLRLCMGLGGSLDVWAGNVRRAPRTVSACGLEWLWRVLCEPRRARIFLDIPHFLFLVLRQRIQEPSKRAVDERK